MQNYVINEGSFLWPGEAWLDNSMNIIRNTQTQASLIVSRGQLAAGRTPEEELDHQWALLLPMVSDLHSEPRQPIVLPLQPNVKAFETLSRFIRAENTHHQYQLAVGLPDNTALLIFTLSAMQPFTEEEKLYWQRFKETLKLN